MRDDVPTPDDYTTEDGFDTDQAVECCPHCGDPWSMNGGMQGPAFEQDGTRHDYYLDADPQDGPLFCGECFHELDTNRRQTENATLGDFNA